jgi:hypothetical protein
VGLVPRTLRIGGLLALLGVMLGLAGAAGAGNHVVYPDATGDNGYQSSTNYASDVRSVDVSGTDDGTVHISVTLVDADGRMVPGDELNVYLNTDRKSTGQNGFDYALEASGNPSGQPSFFLCSLGTPVDCQAGLPGYAAETYPAAGTHVVTFNITTGDAAFDFYVLSSYQQPGGSTTLKDLAPNSGAFTYATNADPDRDGVFGAADACPTKTARGVNDANHNGCPGPFAFIGVARHYAATLSSANLQLKKLWFEGSIPAGARVRISSGSRGETLTSGRGYVRSRRFHGTLRFGTVLTVRITKPGYVGFYAHLVVTHGGLAQRGKKCIRATGSQAPVPCSSSLRGK